MICYFFFKQKTAYEMRISDWSSDVCSSDLKLLRDHGKAMKTLIRELQDGLPPAGDALAALRPPLVTALAALEHATAWLLDDRAKSIAKGAAGATPYLALFGSVLRGWLPAKSALQAQQEGGSSPPSTLTTPRVHAATPL